MTQTEESPRTSQVRGDSDPLASRFDLACTTRPPVAPEQPRVAYRCPTVAAIHQPRRPMAQTCPRATPRPEAADHAH